MNPPKNPKYGQKFIRKAIPSYNIEAVPCFYVGKGSKKTAYFIAEGNGPYYYDRWHKGEDGQYDPNFRDASGSWHSWINTYIPCECIAWSKIEPFDPKDIWDKKYDELSDIHDRLDDLLMLP